MENSIPHKGLRDIKCMAEKVVFADIYTQKPIDRRLDGVLGD